jgi:hypothetical protein
MRLTKEPLFLTEALAIWDSPRNMTSKQGQGIRCRRVRPNGRIVEQVCTTRLAIEAFYGVTNKGVTVGAGGDVP